MFPTIETEGDVLVIRLPIDEVTVENARLSKSGNARLVASLSEKVANVGGHTLRLSLNLMRKV